MFTAVFTAFLLPISKFPHSYTFLCFLTKGVPLRNKWLFLFMSQFGFSAAGINHSFLFFLGWRFKYQWGETTCWQIHVRLHYCTNTAKEPLPFTNSPVPKTAHGQRKHTSAPWCWRVYPTTVCFSTESSLIGMWDEVSCVDCIMLSFWLVLHRQHVSRVYSSHTNGWNLLLLLRCPYNLWVFFLDKIPDIPWSRTVGVFADQEDWIMQ